VRSESTFREHDLTDQIWEERLLMARDPAEILAVSKQFLASWRPAQLAGLPKECRPPLMGVPDDLGIYAFTLARFLRLNDHDAEVERMASYFVAAQQRLSEVLTLADHRLPRPHFFSDGALRQS
jgi:hypothetical protein